MADEIIVVDNNCTDKTVAIARQYPVKVIHESKQGITYARNAGFDAAIGDIIVRCDADNIVPSDWLKKIRGCFKNRSIVAVTGTIIFNKIQFAPQLAKLRQFFYIRLSKTLLGIDVLCGANYALRRTIWKKVRNHVCLDDSSVHEDFDLAIHLKPYGRTLFAANLVVTTSGRKFSENPVYYTLDYAFRWFKTIIKHSSVTGQKINPTLRP